MTEAEWHNCNVPGKRVWCLLELGVATDRKLRLLGVAHGRESAHLRSDPDSLHRLAVIERYADGLASDDELAEVRGEADDAAARWSAVGPEGVDPLSDEQSRKKAVARAHRAVGQLARITDRDPPLGLLVGGALWDLWAPGVSAVDDIFGNPFRPVVFHPEWRTEVVVALARGCYDDRAWERLPVLADALEDAGCRRCSHRLAGDDPAPLVHQAHEVPDARPHVTEYRQHRLSCPGSGAVTCGELPADAVGGYGPGPRPCVPSWPAGTGSGSGP